LGGHPLHPLLVGLPVGLFVWTVIADVVYLVTEKDLVWYDIAYWSGMAAWISALVAALPGIVDFIFVASKSDARGMAAAHGGLNVAVVGLFAVATLLMWDHGALTGEKLSAVLALHFIGASILALAGWLGGELVFRHHLAVVPYNSALEQEELRQRSGARPQLRPR
jgi:uncharacterized membrane protein